MDDNFIERLLSKTYIEDIVGEHVILRSNSGRFVGLCPFHSEKTASFTVFPDTQSFYCFGCGKGGSAITFLQLKENVDRIDAIRILADKAGMEMPQSGGSEEYRRIRDLTIQMNTDIARHYYENLMGENGSKGREYFRNRALKASTVKRFGLGYALDSWDDGIRFLLSKGYKKEDMVAAGLAVMNDKGHIYDRFRNRVMFPVIDTRGKIIAFGGRVLDDSKPKYLNSPETAAFKKSSTLFALNFAKNNNNGRLILCEGYMDVISLHQAGFGQAVATNGTAITPEHARLISRYAKEVVIAYDSDSAGQNATNKAIKLLNETGISVRVLSLDDGKDPDEYIKAHGADKFARLLDGSGSHISFALNKARAKYDINLPEDKSAFLQDAAKILSEIYSPVEQEVYITKVCREADIPDGVLKAEIAQVIRRKKNTQKKNELKNAHAKVIRDKLNPDKENNLKAAMAEEGLLAILLKHPDYYMRLEPKITAADFVTEFNKEIFSVLEEYITEQKPVNLGVISERLSPEQISKLTAYSVSTVSGSNEMKQACDYSSAIINASSDKPDIANFSPEQIQQYIKDKRK